MTDDDQYRMDPRGRGGRRGGDETIAQPLPVRRPRPAARPQGGAGDSTRMMPSGPRGGAQQPAARPASGRPYADPHGGGRGYDGGGYDGGRGYDGGGYDRPPNRPEQPQRPAGRAPRRRRRWPRVLAAFVVIVGLWAGLLLWAGLAAWHKVARVDAIPTGDQPAAGKGTNVLLVGSDSRAGLTSAQAKALRTGGSNITGSRTDSIMVLHMPDSGEPTLVSIPRDTYVQIPGHRANKINAAFSYGPQVLVQTVENVTGLRIEHYMEIGFGGFAGIVDSVGGVRMCLPKAMDDTYAHINLPAGCQNLSGANALGYVRSRHVDATSDLARVKRQREFLAALTKKVASPGNLLVPWRLKNVGESGAQGLAVENGMHSWTALRILWTLKKIGNGGNSVQVPIANAAYPTSAGEAVLWDKTKAAALFDALNHDRSPDVAP
ncbi:LCP family protein [Allobranchiibius sp. GilTou73]|uniref:LCP family protein n=1 Tax=Allobranchiibius sp. GilTou73 TaxID=2904523 RepID=UPI001F1C227E|nr:LCP family protein [Allobranchiibius sp. GilTou73]UIJ34654.1 LCP family protein [Allobranchiibius sp. GilTou73]